MYSTDSTNRICLPPKPSCPSPPLIQPSLRTVELNFWHNQRKSMHLNSRAASFPIGVDWTNKLRAVYFWDGIVSAKKEERRTRLPAMKVTVRSDNWNGILNPPGLIIWDGAGQNECKERGLYRTAGMPNSFRSEVRATNSSLPSRGWFPVWNAGWLCRMEIQD